MRARLKLKRYDEQTIEAVVEDLRKIGEIDDGKFAGFWVESRMHVKPVGDALLRRELAGKGVSEPVIEAALREKALNHDEYALALGVAEGRLKSLAKLNGFEAAKKLRGLLLRRGFGYETVGRVIETLCHAVEDDS